jgi:hypothetical protein
MDRGDRIRIINARQVTPLNVKCMKSPSNNDDQMRPEYDLRGGVRGKYFEQYKQGTNVVLLDPDLASVFGDSDAVNKALRVYLAEHGKPSDSKKK